MYKISCQILLHSQSVSTPKEAHALLLILDRMPSRLSQRSRPRTIQRPYTYAYCRVTRGGTRPTVGSQQEAPKTPSHLNCRRPTHHCCGSDEGIAPVGLVLVRSDRPGGPPLSTVHVRGACGNHVWVPCTKKGDWWHQEKLFEGCSKSLLREHLVESRSVGELFMNYSPNKYEHDNS